MAHFPRIPRAALILAAGLSLVSGACSAPRPAGDSAAGSAAMSSPAIANAQRAAAADSMIKDSISRARQDSINRTLPGYVVDSILPVEEMLRRFRSTIGGAAVTTLSGGAPSRDALVQTFITSLVAADSIQLRRLAISPREFADLIYPESPNTKPPYRQDPALVWRSIQNPSGTGFRRLIRRAGGIPVKLANYACGQPVRQGRNVLWPGCTLRLIGPQGDTSTHRFFGTIVERDGQWKILSFRNEF